MAYSESLADRIRQVLGRRPGINEKKMFGGIGFLLSGKMLVGIWKTSLIARIGPDSYDDALARDHVRPFDITGRAMRGWVLVEAEGIELDEQLRAWIENAIKYVAGLSR